jgi:peptide/nickel transport system permease protein
LKRSRGGRIAWRLCGALVVILGVTFLTFLLAYLSPADAAISWFADRGIYPSEEELIAKRAELGVDRPFFEQYLSWMWGLCHGDLGESLRNGAPVADTLMEALPFTLALTAVSLVMTLVVSIPLGLLCARYRDSAYDQFMRFITYLFNALPNFFIALLMLYLLCVRLGWFSVIPTYDFKGIFMPSVALALPLSAWYIRQVRALALGQINAGYVSGLRARGVSETRILVKHVLRNLAVPLLTLVGISLGSLLGGAVIVENIFGWPGVGGVSVLAIGHRDYIIIQAYALLMAIVFLIVNALVDFSYRFIDPRVRKRG